MWLFGLFLMLFAFGKGEDFSFDFGSYQRENKLSHLQNSYFNLTTNVSKIEIRNIPVTAGFWVIQIHSYIFNVTLSTSQSFPPLETVTGTNIGLTADKNTTFYVKASTAILGFVAVIVYDEKDPVPGGCNLGFKTEIAPYQVVTYTDEVIVVESLPPKSPGVSCEKNNSTVDLYHLYLPEYSLTQSSYFDGIQNMLTVNKIVENGYKVKTDDGRWRYHKLYASYRGVGHVFAIVATYNGHSSAYVPAISYGCDLSNLGESCYGPVTNIWKVLCALMLILGMFTCFFGHQFFRFTLFSMGCVVGIFCTYIILFDNTDSLSIADITISSVIAGIIGGVMWVIFWKTCGLPIVSASFTYLLLGFLISSIIFYSGTADNEIFRSNSVFWLSFCGILFSFYLIFLCLTIVSHPLGCSCLGAYAFVVALSYYMGGNLQYIIINIFRRIVVDDFNHATIDPPFQVIDAFQCLVLVTLSMWGFYYQMRQIGVRPPFPSNYSPSEIYTATESTPLFNPRRGGRENRRTRRFYNVREL